MHLFPSGNRRPQTGNKKQPYNQTPGNKKRNAIFIGQVILANRFFVLSCETS